MQTILQPLPKGEAWITPDSPRGHEIGFTSENFEGFLVEDEKSIAISFLAAKKQGRFKTLCEKILSLGKSIRIPTPIGRMRQIVEEAGYTQTTETHSFDDDGETITIDVEVWRKDPTQKPVAYISKEAASLFEEDDLKTLLRVKGVDLTRPTRIEASGAVYYIQNP